MSIIIKFLHWNRSYVKIKLEVAHLKFKENKIVSRRCSSSKMGFQVTLRLHLYFFLSSSNANASTEVRVQQSCIWIASQQLSKPAAEQKEKEKKKDQGGKVTVILNVITDCCLPCNAHAARWNALLVRLVETQFTADIVRRLSRFCLAGKHISQL